MEELGLDCSSPEEPTYSRLDEWYLPGHHQHYSRQRPSLFFLEIHDELTRTWYAPYTAHVHTVTSVTSPESGLLHRLQVAKLYPFPKRQGPHPQMMLVHDAGPDPYAEMDKRRESVPTKAGLPSKKACIHSLSPCLALGEGSSV